MYAACHLENGRREQVRRDNQYARQCFPTALNDSTQRARVQERVGPNSGEEGRGVAATVASEGCHAAWTLMDFRGIKTRGDGLENVRGTAVYCSRAAVISQTGRAGKGHDGMGGGVRAGGVCGAFHDSLTVVSQSTPPVRFIRPAGRPIPLDGTRCGSQPRPPRVVSESQT